MTIKDYLAVLRLRWMLAVGVVILSTLSTVVLSMRQSPVYEAKSRILVALPVGLGDGDPATFLRNQGVYKQINTEAELIRSGEVAEMVIEKLNLRSSFPDIKSEDLIEKIVVMGASFNDVLNITVTEADPKLATALANEFPEQYLQFRTKQALAEAKTKREDIGKRSEQLITRLAELEVAARRLDPNSTQFALLKGQRDALVIQLTQLENLQTTLLDESSIRQRIGDIIQYASVPEPKSKSDPIRMAVLGMIIGIPLALGLALMLDAMNDTVKTKEEAEKVVGAEMLGVIPLSPDWRSSSPYLVTKEAPYSAAAEAYRTLRINLTSKGVTGEGKKVLFTSPGIGEGKTLSSANVATAFAESGRSVLLVSADMRRPRIHTLFGVEASPGLSDVLEGGVITEDLIHEPSPNLYVLASGRSDERPDQLLSRVDFKQVLDDVVLPRRGDHKDAVVRNGDGQGSYGTKTPKASKGSSIEGSTTRQIVGTQPDVILLDAPSVLGAAEVSAMAGAVDGVILILHAGVTRREAAARAAEQVRRAGGRVAGVVLVGVRLDDDYSLYPPLSDERGGDPSDSTWSKVLSGLRK